MRIIGIIPARYASTRLPGKALEKIGDKTMIRHVYEQAGLAASLSGIWVATDHAAIEAEVNSFGGQAVMTSPSHPSGTDRCLEALEKTGETCDFVINIQGDEPFIAPEQIDLLASMCDENTQIATLTQPLKTADELFNANVVKVVPNNLGEALYFSRAAIPAHRDLEKSKWLDAYSYYKHIGMYAYRTDILRQITRLSPGRLELVESLEQLRWLEAGYKIHVGVTSVGSSGIDTPEDLERARREYNRNRKAK